MKLQIDNTMQQRVRDAEKFRTPKNILLQCLIFFAVFIIGALGQSLALMPRLTYETTAYAQERIDLNGTVTEQEVEDYMMQLLSTEPYVIMTLYATLVATFITILFCRFIEKRRLSTMGFTAKGAWPQYLFGLAAGFAMFSAVVGLSFAMGGISPTEAGAFELSSFLLICGGWIFQGASEEIIFRGYFMTTLMRRHSVVTAVLINAVGFALAHGGNNGISIMALLNLTLFGVMISLYVLRTHNLWGACAIHSIWNLVQGNFYGLPVSGMDTGGSVMRFRLVDGMELVNGGAFGAEAGIPTTIVLLAASAVLLFVPFGKKENA